MLAKTPHLFGEIRQPTEGNYILVPGVSTSIREYVPMDFFDHETILLNSCLMVPGGDLYLLGVMSSAMHMAWIRSVGGRLGMGYRYSANQVYNTFPWPRNPTAKQKGTVVQCVNQILSIRQKNNIPIGKLYSQMPLELEIAHKSLDRAVDVLYKKKGFASKRARVLYLFSEYERRISPLAPTKKRRKKKT